MLSKSAEGNAVASSPTELPYIFSRVYQANLVKLDIGWWKCEIRHGYPGTAHSQRGSVWCVLAVVLFIQHIILMSVTPTTFWGEQSSVITEALLLIYNLSVALLADPWNSSTCRQETSFLPKLQGPIFLHGTHLNSDKCNLNTQL